MPRLANTSIFQSHGSVDQVLPLQAGIWLRDALTEAGCEVDFVEFLGPHTIPMEALEHTALMLSALSRGA
jgi:phospholipase/carboxylesterase